MTLKELSQLYWLNREIEADQRRLEDLQVAAYAPPPPDLSGMPRANGNSRRVESMAVEITTLQGIIRAKRDQCIYERVRLEQYITDIPDSLTRQIFTLRFVNGLDWAQVAYSIGGGNTPDSVKKTCYRYLRRNP